eukprot:GHVQ01017256.1.p1 GENE.GHVQ01017256.1~~GHVQ01017256.1.p1  ORF type:complete len:873 (-),score=99.64 GHVQ01017256.1:360-2978(-)
MKTCRQETPGLNNGVHGSTKNSNRRCRQAIRCFEDADRGNKILVDVLAKISHRSNVVKQRQDELFLKNQWIENSQLLQTEASKIDDWCSLHLYNTTTSDNPNRNSRPDTVSHVTHFSGHDGKERRNTNSNYQSTSKEDEGKVGFDKSRSTQCVSRFSASNHLRRPGARLTNQCLKGLQNNGSMEKKDLKEQTQKTCGSEEFNNRHCEQRGNTVDTKVEHRESCDLQNALKEQRCKLMHDAERFKVNCWDYTRRMSCLVENARNVSTAPGLIGTCSTLRSSSRQHQKGHEADRETTHELTAPCLVKWTKISNAQRPDETKHDYHTSTAFQERRRDASAGDIPLQSNNLPNLEQLREIFSKGQSEFSKIADKLKTDEIAIEKELKEFKSNLELTVDSPLSVLAAAPFSASSGSQVSRTRRQPNSSPIDHGGERLRPTDSSNNKLQPAGVNNVSKSSSNQTRKQEELNEGDACIGIPRQCGDESTDMSSKLRHLKQNLEKSWKILCCTRIESEVSQPGRSSPGQGCEGVPHSDSKLASIAPKFEIIYNQYRGSKCLSQSSSSALESSDYWRSVQLNFPTVSVARLRKLHDFYDLRFACRQEERRHKRITAAHQSCSSVNSKIGTNDDAANPSATALMDSISRIKEKAQAEASSLASQLSHNHKLLSCQQKQEHASRKFFSNKSYQVDVACKKRRRSMLNHQAIIEHNQQKQIRHIELEKRKELKLLGYRQDARLKGRRNRERLKCRTKLSAMKKRRKDLENMHRDEEQAHARLRLQRYQNRIRVVAPKDPQRLVQDTCSSDYRHQEILMEQAVKSSSCKLFTAPTGFTVDELMGDVRYKLSAALHSAGLYTTKPGHEALQAINTVALPHLQQTPD